MKFRHRLGDYNRVLNFYAAVGRRRLGVRMVVARFDDPRMAYRQMTSYRSTARAKAWFAREFRRKRR